MDDRKTVCVCGTTNCKIKFGKGFLYAIRVLNSYELNLLQGLNNNHFDDLICFSCAPLDTFVTRVLIHLFCNFSCVGIFFAIVRRSVFNLNFRKKINKGSRNRTHAGSFEDYCSTTKLYPFQCFNRCTGLLPLWLFIHEIYSPTDFNTTS